jgi:hypothetical protein
LPLCFALHAFLEFVQPLHACVVSNLQQHLQTAPASIALPML